MLKAPVFNPLKNSLRNSIASVSADPLIGFLVTENGGSIKAGESFTVRWSGDFNATPPVSVTIDGVPSSNITVVSSSEFTANAGVINPGSYDMRIEF